ncbi:hypothetical protein [Burkholderia pseudomallei]|uniref:hypothetical protein n=1 Tax=Burkholderia pseudomallei TaxID=28450 RepID=UPI000F0667DB|nr:hypothetical protein [Burkholderia pseudomallei]CAJ3267151.1 Uncharacterised protein [Burkholderia pseudomallei]CAJ3903973.1 Uncharacterised protein [Burkholderia pseudomallei]CAJ5189053.1 Uncharacterised protein [Burkholderia pseudomallei]CAJ5784107.1 Uncharacterised protein [Burkholderia pseudomallei]CAJ6336413.1 Uncharacterised protein [Burkholderia pseudomallei]
MSESVRSQYRIPKDLNDWLLARAKEQERSKNAQLIIELRARMQAEGQSPDLSTRDGSNNE